MTPEEPIKINYYQRSVKREGRDRPRFGGSTRSARFEASTKRRKKKENKFFGDAAPSLLT